ncbi:hypothetical protein CHX27_07195 [Flavobacterium aurantiibacter]|uniref:Uncharacterized protein n=1 Tax=Flavobacterium aurantiibacter TaxID=2023067 RepID=A0A255ZTG7_9FLAO|nr:hypothetical protein CHX27_07195 [Flavobacterium aurantiibacter]
MAARKLKCQIAIEAWRVVLLTSIFFWNDLLVLRLNGDQRKPVYCLAEKRFGVFIAASNRRRLFRFFQ